MQRYSQIHFHWERAREQRQLAAATDHRGSKQDHLDIAETHYQHAGKLLAIMFGRD